MAGCTKTRVDASGCWEGLNLKKQETLEKKTLLDFVYKHYGLDAAKAHGFKARLSLADLRKLKAYAMNHLHHPFLSPNGRVVRG